MASSSTVSQPLYANLYENLKPTVWIIKVKGEVKKKEVYVYTTAFAVRNDGILLTSAHVFNNLSNCSFEVRKLDSNHDVKSASISDMYSYWDLCLLKVDNVVGCECVTLASDGSLRQGDNLFCIANPVMCVGSFGLAHASYACVEDVNIPTGANACSQHVSNVNNETPPYLVMGHFWNRSYLTSNKAPSNNWKRRLHAMIPVVHVGIFVGECLMQQVLPYSTSREKLLECC